MNKLVCGVGVNDLGYATRVWEELPKNGGKRILKSVFRCKYYEVWKNMLQRCYSKNTWRATQPILTLASVTSGCTLQRLKNGWSSKTGMVVSRQRHYCSRKQTLLA